jgi:hypothetical protein
VRAGISLCDERSQGAVAWQVDADLPRAAGPLAPPPAPPPRVSRPASPRSSPGVPPAPRAWLRWGDASATADRAYFPFAFDLGGMLPADDAGPSRVLATLPDLGIHFTVPADLASGGLDAQQADQLARARSPLVVDPPWVGEDGYNQRGERLPWFAVAALTRGSYPEGCALHHLAQVHDLAEQPQGLTSSYGDANGEATPAPSGFRDTRAPSEPDAAAGDQATWATPPDLDLLSRYLASRMGGATPPVAVSECIRRPLRDQTGAGEGSRVVVRTTLATPSLETPWLSSR